MGKTVRKKSKRDKKKLKKERRLRKDKRENAYNMG
jgi:hypothetical protein